MGSIGNSNYRGGCHVGTPVCNPPELRSGPFPVGPTTQLGLTLLVTESIERNKDPGPSGNQDFSSGEAVGEIGMTLESGPCPSASINTCKDCGVVFPSLRSLGMHRYHRHPVEVNQERIVEFHKWNLTSGEDETLRAKADSSWRQGMRRKDHLTHLHVTFPHRTIEALKKRLQILKWTPPKTSVELQQQSPIREDVTDQRRQMTTRTRGSTWTMEAEQLPTQTNNQQVELPITRTANKRGKILKNWLEEEDKLLINEAMKIWVEGMTKRELADKLCPYFHCRTAEAILEEIAESKLDSTT